MIVYEVCGYFGDHEWSEGLFADSEDAHALHDELWKTRKGKGPDYASGLHKFFVETREVKEKASVEAQSADHGAPTPRVPLPRKHST